MTGVETVRLGYTTGVFDMFHIGHLNVIRSARALCDELIVGVTTDELSLARKGKTPVVPFVERLEILESVRYVDRVVVQNSMDKLAAWDEYRFDVMFVGDDWRGVAPWPNLEVELGKRGASITYLPYTVHTSSTILRAKVSGE